MKYLNTRIIALILALMMVCSASLAFAESTATGFDIDGIQDSDFMVTVDEENGYYIIDNDYGCVLEGEGLLPDPGSFEFSQILAYRESEDFMRGVMFICFAICTEEAVNVDSITFQIGDSDFTFSGLYSEDNISVTEDYTYQNARILIGGDNQQMLIEMYDAVAEYLDDETGEELASVMIPVTLHGTKDIETSIDGVACADILSIHQAMQNYNGSFDEIVGTPLTVNKIA